MDENMNFTTEQRNKLRTPCNENIRFYINDGTPLNSGANQQPITATVVDISATGMGVATDLMLNKNQSIFFDKHQPNWELPDEGIVVWSYKQNSGYRAGLEFVMSEGK